MKGKQLKKEVRKAVCALLTAAMLFTDTGMTALAQEETQQTEETYQETDVEETASGETNIPTEEAISQEAPVTEGTTEEASEEKTSGEGDTESALTENASDENNVTNESTEDKAVEDTSTQESPTETMESESISNEETASEDGTDEETETVSETETEAEESVEKLAFSDTDIAHGEYKENGSDITWVIDADRKLTVEGTGDFSSDRRIPWVANREDIRSAVINVKDLKNAHSMFYGCINMTSIDLSEFDTSSVTDMGAMFSGCSSLTSLDVSHFVTSSVTNMGAMFSGCSSLTSLDVSSFDTSSVTSMYQMFSGCRSLTSLDLSNFDTGSVTDMEHMFGVCDSLTNLDVSSFDTSNVTSMYQMFYNCRSLANLDVSSFDTSSVTSMYQMFWECYNLTSLDLSSFDTSSVTDMSEMFYSCRSLTSLDLSGFVTSNVTKMYEMFYSCRSLTNLDVSSFDTSNLASMYRMFSGCSSLTNLDVSSFDTSSVMSMSNMFYSCSGLTSLDLSNFDTSNVADMRTMFGECSSLINLNVSSFDTSRVVSMSQMFDYCSSLTNLDVSSFDTSRVSSMSVMFRDCRNLTKLDLSKFDTSNVTDMEGMFSGCSGLASLDLSNFDTSNVTDMGGMFFGCSGLASLDLSNFDTSSVTSMGYMFKSSSGLTSLDVSSFDTSSVTSMTEMFNGCSGLASLDLSNFDTSSVTSMAGMFKSSSGLTNLGLSIFNTSSVTSMEEMFFGCVSLTGLDLSSFDTGSVTNMYNMFNGCSGLEKLDLSNFDTSSVTKMTHMFNGCSGLEELDLSNFDTSSVTNMYRMFQGCSNLINLDLSSFDTSSLTDMNYMFQGCSSLTSLDLSSIDAKNVQSTSEISLSDCSSLTQIYLPRNLRVEFKLPTAGKWYDKEGNYYTVYPPTGENSILLCRDTVPQATEARIVVKKVKTFYSCGEALDMDDITVMYYGADATARTLAKTEYTTNAADIEMGTAGEKKLTVIYSPAEGESLTADIQLTVGILLDDTNVTITLPDADAFNYIFDKKAKRPMPTVVYNGGGIPITLTENIDYTVAYKNNKNAYQYMEAEESTEMAPAVIITGCGSYTGKITRAFSIEKVTSPDLKEIVRMVKAGVATSDNFNIALYLAKYEKITGYKAGTPIEDGTVSGNVLGEKPNVSSNGYFSYRISKTAAVGDFVTIPVTISFVNYEDAVLNVKIVVEGDSAGSKKKVKISGIEVKDSVYNKIPVFYTGTAKVTLDTDNTDLTNKVKLVYTYRGTQADGSVYAASTTAPINAGSYKLTVAVASDNADYTGSMEYPFTIAKAPLTITARDMGLKIGAELPKKEDYQFDIAGLLEGDILITNPTLSCNIADTAAAGEYEIAVSGANAGMNYDITYKNGTLKVSETGESAAYYTVTFNMSGHGSDITNTGIKEGSLLEKPQDPQAEGYTFTGWYKDQNCTVLWDFAKDMIQSDTTIYAGWKANDNDDDDSAFADTERTSLSAVSATIANIKPRVYDGNAYEPTVKVTANVSGKKTALVEGIDYRVIYKDNIKAGTATVTIKGNGIYKDSVSKSYTISPKSVKKLKVVTGSITSAQTGAVLTTLPVYVYDGTKRLSYGTDFSLSNYNVTKSTAKVTVTGMGNYTGAVNAKLSVYAVDSDKIINSENVEAIYPVPYNAGKAVKPEPTVTTGGVKLTKNKDYKIQYQNNKNAGTAYVIVTGKGAYKGKVVVPFEIKAAQVTSDEVIIKPISAKTYNGKYQKPVPTVTIKSGNKTKKLVKNKDYTVTYKNNRHAGTATVTVTGKGNYEGMSARTTFIIKPQNIAKASLKGTQGNLRLTYSKGILKQGTDYEEPVYGELKRNKIKVTIKGKGDFTGTMTKSVKM